jgi:beta-glucosidase
MLKYKEIIERLSDKDKVRIISNVDELSDAKYRVLGIPSLKFASIDDYGKDDYPSFVALANTWNMDIIGAVAGERTERMLENRVNIAEIRGPKAKIDPCRVAISEDPMIATAVSSKVAEAVSERGINVSLSDYSIRTTDTKWLDNDVDDRFMNEYIIQPFKACAEKARVCSLESRSDIYVGGYEKINSDLEKRTSDVCEGAYAICREITTEKTVRYLQNGGMFYKGSAVALEAALNRHNNLQKAIKHNTATEEELAEEIAKGRAISPQMLDEAVDRLLDFAFSVKREYTPVAHIPDEELFLNATRESIVLLKNDNNMLPIDPTDKKIAIVGDIIMRDDLGQRSAAEEYKQALEDAGMTVIGTARGYDLGKERSESLVDEARELANSADTVLLFLGLGSERESFAPQSKKISLPANQQDLLRKLANVGSKVVAVVSGEFVPDIVYRDSCAALVYAPLNVRACPTALAQMLIGALNPCGRLASTSYFDAESLYKNKRKLAIRDKLKTGPFVGYRYYDTAGNDVGYVFGHGLSYTSFSYSDITVSGNVARLTIKNVGAYAGVETVQIYVGENAPSVIRPRKELAGFMRVGLKPKESITVEIPFVIPRVYDGESNSMVAPKGKYTVYAGSSVSDIRLTAQIEAGDVVLANCGEYISKYIQTESNILSDDYKLEEEFTDMRRKTVYNITAGAVSLALAILLKIYCVLAGFESVIFDLFAIALGIVGVVFFVVEAIYRNKEYLADKEKMNKINEEAFEGAETVPVYAAEKLFVKEFDVSAEEKKAEEVDAGLEGIDKQYHLYIDNEQTFENAAKEFEQFAAEKGFKFDTVSIKKIFASIAASRLIVVRGMEEESFKNLLMLLGGYFETTSYIDTADETYTTHDNVLFKKNEQGNRVKTNICIALESARSTPQSIHFAGLFGASLEGLNTYFEPFVSFAKNPLASCRVTALNENFAETTYHIPQNLWFVVNIDAAERIDALSRSTYETASLNTIRFSPCESTPHQDGMKKFSYYQLEYLCEKLGAIVDVEEDEWKKIDRLEEYVAAHSEYAIGNKMWLGLEKYVSVYIACAGETLEAIDAGTSAKLLPSMICVLSGNMTKEEKYLADVLEDIFGEDNADTCTALVKDCGADIV